VRTTGPKPCRVCQTGQRLSDVTFAVFAIGLLAAASDPEETALRQILLTLCAGLSGLAVFRFPLARLATWHLARRRLRKAPPKHQSRTLQP
jgi:hypothetical protein